jgi:hypothetical protein
LIGQRLLAPQTHLRDALMRAVRDHGGLRKPKRVSNFFPSLGTTTIPFT